jgi:uncharacterized phiE125 gp8 family phage protein
VETAEFNARARRTLVTGPTEEPLSIAEVMAHLRLDTTDDAALLEQLITTARLRVEADTGRALITQTWEAWWDSAPPGTTLDLPAPPLISVSSVTSYNDAGTPAVLAATNYLVDVISQPGRLVLTTAGAWPTDLRSVNAFVVRYVAGYGAAAAVPAPLRQAMLLLIASLYEHREEVLVTQFAGQFIETPLGYHYLVQPYRVLWVM